MSRGDKENNPGTSQGHCEHPDHTTEQARKFLFVYFYTSISTFNVQKPANPYEQNDARTAKIPSSNQTNQLAIAPKETNPFFLKYKTLIAFAVIFVVGAIFAVWWIHPYSELLPKHQSCEHFQPLASKYPHTTDELWATLVVGVERAVNDPGEPATFIFLYNSSSVGQFLSLMDDVIRTTNKCFGNGGAIWRTSDDFKSLLMTQDHRAVLERHREELQEQGVLVVRDLDQVPPNAAQVFFTICDSYEPLVRKAAIFFTIDISQQAVNQSQRHPTSIAEGILKDLWRKELHSNVLNALVVRLTENVFKIE